MAESLALTPRASRLTTLGALRHFIAGLPDDWHLSIEDESLVVILDTVGVARHALILNDGEFALKDVPDVGEIS